MARKYLKFGLRADLNLSDLSDKNAALNNILNDIASSTDTEGNLLGFTKDDISALIGLSATGLGQDTALNEEGLPLPLVRLAGTSVLTQNAVGDEVPVEPRVTIQDKINIHKNVMGDPPFASGGDGPNAKFIPGDRLSLNANVIGTEITGDNAIVGNKYNWTGNTGTVNHDTITADLNILTGENRPVGADGTAQVSGQPYIIHTLGTFDFKTRGAESNTVGLVYTANSGSALANSGKAIPGVLATSAVAGKKYTILAIGNTSVSDWISLGCTEYPHVGTTFTAAIAGSGITGTTSYITEQWVVGNEISVTQTSPGSGVGSTVAYTRENRLNWTGTDTNSPNPDNYIRLYIRNASNTGFIDVSTVLSVGQTVTFSQRTDNSLGSYNSSTLFTTQTIADIAYTSDINYNFARIYWVDGSGNDVLNTGTGGDQAIVNVTANATESGSFTSVNLIKLRNVTMPSGDGQDTIPSSVSADTIYSTVVDSAFTNIETTGDFWDDGIFEFQTSIHPNFNDSFGGVQWEGYQDGQFGRMDWLTTGFFMVEEDVYNDNSWELKKAITSENVYPIGRLKFASASNESGVTVTQVELSNVKDYLRIAKDMTLSFLGQDCLVQRVRREYDSTTAKYRYFVDLDRNIDLSSYPTLATIGTYVNPTDTTNSEFLHFVWQLGVAVETDETVHITVPTSGKRRHVRYTVWWPVSNDIYSTARLEELNRESIELSFNYFYKTNEATDFTNAKHSFPFFMENKLGPRSQDSNFSTTVDNTVSIEYTPSLLTTDKFYDFNEVDTDSHNIIEELIEVREEGTVTSTTSTSFFNEFSRPDSEGEWLVVRPSTDPAGANPIKIFAYQIIEKQNDGKAAVPDTYRTEIGVALHEKHGAMLVSNIGLVGIYKHEATTGTGVRDSELSYADYKVLPQKLDTGAKSMNRDVSLISLGDIVHIADLDFIINATTSKTHKYAFTVVHIDADNTVHLKKHPSNANVLTNATKGTIQPGIMAVYSSKGLLDKTTETECIGVFGRTVDSDRNQGQTQITLDHNGISIGDFVQLEGAIPANTKVRTVSSGYVLLGSDDGAGGYNIVNTTAPIIAGQTVVIVKPSAANNQGYPGENKEYCVIPLNTAPPWTGTSDGLATPTAFPNLIVKELKFKDLQLNTPVLNIGPRGDGTTAWDGSVGTISTNSPSKYFSIFYDVPS